MGKAIFIIACLTMAILITHTIEFNDKTNQDHTFFIHCANETVTYINHQRYSIEEENLICWDLEYK